MEITKDDDSWHRGISGFRDQSTARGVPSDPVEEGGCSVRCLRSHLPFQRIFSARLKLSSAWYPEKLEQTTGL